MGAILMKTSARMTPVSGAAHAAKPFRYRAIDRRGAVITGLIEAPDRRTALLEIEQMALMPIELDTEQLKSSPLSWLLYRTIKPEDVTEITRDLAMLIAGGVNLDQALDTIGDTCERPALAAALHDLKAGVSAGKSLAMALSTHPALFPSHYVKMVEVAEAQGSLSETLMLIAQQRARSQSLRARILSAVAYPAFLFAAATAVLAFVLVYVVPEFERALVGFQDTSSAQTSLIFVLSRGFRDGATPLLIVAIVFLAVALVASRRRSVRSALFRFMSVLPGVGRAVADQETAVISATLSGLLASGVDVSSSLRLVRDLMHDRQSAARLDKAVRGVRQGRRLSDVMQEQGVLPSYATQILRVGEESGEVTLALTRIAALYEEKLDTRLRRITAIVGPGVLITVSVIVAWIIVSVMSALLSMNDLLLSGRATDAAAAFA